MRFIPAKANGRTHPERRRRAFRESLLPGLLLLPQPAFAGDGTTVPLVITIGAVALAVATSLCAIAANNAAARLRRSIAAVNARARSAVAAREAIIEAGREKVLVWQRNGGGATNAFGGSEHLLNACLAGPDALILSQALDDLADTGAPFAFTARAHDGAVRLRGRAVGGDVTLWMEEEAETKTSPASTGADIYALLDALPMPIWLRDSSLALAWVNRAYSVAAGMPDAASVITEQKALDKSERDLALSAKRDEKAVEAKRYVVIQGERRVLSITNAPLKDGGILGMALDVTEASSAQTRLQQHIDAHTDTLDKLTTAVAIFDSDQRLTFYNRAFLRLWGIPEEWLKSNPTDSDILDRLREMRKLPEQRDFQAWKRDRISAYARTEAFVPEELWHLPGGETLRVVAQPGPVGGLTYLYEDITERIALESSYNTLIGVQRATLDTLGEGVAVFGLDGRLKLHNIAFLRLWQFGPDELMSEPHLQEIAKICVQRFGENPFWQKLQSSISSGEGRRRDWGEFERSDRVVLSVALAPLPDGAMLVTFTDVTDRFRAEAALRDRNQALLAADELKSEFVQHASFLFRNPLNAAQGFAELLAVGHAGPLNPKQKDYVDNILTASRSLAETTSDILDLALIDSGSMRLELAQVDLHELLARASEPLREHATSRDIRFTFAVPRDVGTAVLDRRRIRQVIFNLLSNALKFTPRGGAVELGARIVGEDVQIHVRDSGPGIAPDVQPRVFGQFEAKGRSGQRRGAGLGLALVNRFVTMHDGWVEIETAEGHGTLVRCHLPRRISAEPALGREDTHAA
ncbi:MAG: PAS-domain containing protein [Alphaproteobacteria bacterium]|nr:PAS-domain containing protein [Alphaproteobacteria bacterium]